MLPVLNRGLLLCCAAGLIATGGCDKPQRIGDVNAIIVGVPDAQWSRIESAVDTALEPRAFTVRDERIFRVTQVDPSDTRWNDFRRFTQLLLIGEPGDPWMTEAVDNVPDPLPPLPAVVNAGDVFARDQQVTLALLPPGGGIGAVRALLPELREKYLTNFSQYVRARMYASGVNTELADSLRQNAGFSLQLPKVYYGRQLADSAYLFRNDFPDPSELIRSVLVTWRPLDGGDLDASQVLDWRERAAELFYAEPQATGRDEITSGVRSGEGPRSVEVRGVWSAAPGEYPGAGPFITRLFPCPAQNREYLLDAWLYAPGSEKFEYVLQLETILNSFECVSG